MDRTVKANSKGKIKDLLLLDDSEMDLMPYGSSGNLFRTTSSSPESSVPSTTSPVATLLSYKNATSSSSDVVLPSSPAASAAATAAPMQAVLASPLNGQFYVIGNPSDVLGAATGAGGRSLAPRVAGTTTITTNAGAFTIDTGGAPPKDERRRATHNEVERRRRDTINTGILKLSKLIPDLNGEGSSSKTSRSKGDILTKACEYVAELRNTNMRLQEKMSHKDQVVLENERLKQQVEDLTTEIELLRQTLQSNSILLPPSTTDQSLGADILG